MNVKELLESSLNIKDMESKLASLRKESESAWKMQDATSMGVLDRQIRALQKKLKAARAKEKQI